MLMLIHQTAPSRLLILCLLVLSPVASFVVGVSVATAQEPDEELRDLQEWRQELQREEKELAEESTAVRNRIQQVSRLIEFKKQVRSIDAELEAAEDQDDHQRVEKLEEQLERIEERLQAEMQLVETVEELGEELHEWHEAIRELEEMIEEDVVGEEDVEEAFDALHGIIKVIRGLQSLHLKLSSTEPAARDEIEKEIESAEKKADRLRRLLRRMEAEFDGEEFDDGDDEYEDEDGDADREKKKDVIAPELLPVVVNEQTLAPYANVDLSNDVTPLLKQFCFDCHSNDSDSGDLNIEKLVSVRPLVKNREHWVNVIEQVKNHVMPTRDGDQPTLEQRQQLVLGLYQLVYNFDYSDIHNPGFEPVRRLSHREYANTVRDLFAVDIDVSGRFPDDLTATSGFDNSANSLFIQPLLMERYIGTAEYVVVTALPIDSDVELTDAQVAARKRILFREPSADVTSAEAAGEILQRFMSRAYRAPVDDESVARVVKQVERAIASGAEFSAAIRSALQTVLISPRFLLRAETNPEKSSDDGDEAFAISEWDLASRLSYFLWASMPDDQLSELAANKRLSDPAELDRQITRMLADPRADSLGTIFTSQWLGAQHLGTRIRADPIDNPWCTETLMEAMRQETAMFFTDLVRNNRPITELITADYTFLNEELAKHYRIPGVKGDAMRRVNLHTEQRGGILGHGSLLAVTSFPGRTSPVVRGKWILADILGTPPAPPPPNASEFSEEIEESRGLSFREKLEKHRANPNCYACHSEMDPLGLSLENYDWFGRFRERRGRGRVDVSGQLPDGTTFEGLPGLKKVLVEKRSDDLTRQVTKKMLSYALGRQLEYYDEPAVQKIIGAVDADGGRLQTLIREIAMSYPFRYKQRERPW